MFRAFSLVGRVIVMVAMVLVGRWVRVVRIDMLLIWWVKESVRAWLGFGFEGVCEISYRCGVLKDRESPILNAGKGYEVPRRVGDMGGVTVDRGCRAIPQATVNGIAGCFA